jgi:predicted aspartyl protease
MTSAPIQVVEGELGSARFLVRAGMDGREETFQLDTGSSYTSVANSAFTETYEACGSMSRTSASGKSRTEEKIRFASFRIGRRALTPFEAVRYRKEQNQDNRLGMDALACPFLSFDLTNWRLGFADGMPPALPRAALASYAGGTFGVQVTLGGKPAEALWDTGAELSVVDRELVSASPAAFEFSQKIHNGLDATGEAVDFDLYHVPVFEMGGRNLPTAIMAMDFAMVREKVGKNIQVILGTNTLRGHRWYFDFAGRTWAME